MMIPQKPIDKSISSGYNDVVPTPEGRSPEDTVHEMARDKARHGKALKGLLDRYFGK